MRAYLSRTDLFYHFLSNIPLSLMASNFLSNISIAARKSETINVSRPQDLGTGNID